MSKPILPICVSCEISYKVQKTSVIVQILPEPAEYYFADLLKCPQCGNQILYGFGEAPIKIYRGT